MVDSIALVISALSLVVLAIEPAERLRVRMSNAFYRRRVHAEHLRRLEEGK